MSPTQGTAGPSNPFTKAGNRMRRNTRDSKWVSVDPEHGRPGTCETGKTATFKTHQSASAKENAASTQACSKSATSYDQAASPDLQAAIHDATDLEMLPVTHARLPSIRSWSNLRSETGNDDAISPRTLTFRNVQYQANISPVADMATTSPHSPELQNDAARVSAQDRKESNATIFPGSPGRIKKPEVKESPPNLAGFFRAAKELYNVGPQGEGQKLWSSYTGSRKAEPVLKKENRTLPKQLQTVRRPSAPGLSDHPPTGGVPPNEQSEGMQRQPLAETLYPRKESDTSRTSCEVPIRIDHDSQQYVDRSKPFPPAPLLQPAPKRKEQGYTEIELKPLPLTPKVRSSQVNSDDLPNIPPAQTGKTNKSRHASKPSKSSTHSDILGPVSTHAQCPVQVPNSFPSSKNNKKSKKLTTIASTWWSHLADLTSESYIPASKPLPKPLISRPRPITALEQGRTVNLDPACGGVGGPDAVRPSQLDPRGKGKQRAMSPPPLLPLANGHKSKTWREMLGSPREGAGESSKGVEVRRSGKRDSDMSFMCVGVDRGGGSGSGKVGEVGERRDTRFYGAWEEVLEEYEK